MNQPTTTNLARIIHAKQRSMDRFVHGLAVVKTHATTILGALKTELAQVGEATHDPDPPNFETLKVWLHSPIENQKVDGFPAEACIVFDGKFWYFGVALTWEQAYQKIVSLLIRCEVLSDPGSQTTGQKDLKVSIVGMDGTFDLSYQTTQFVNSIPGLIVKKFDAKTCTPWDTEPLLIGYAGTKFADTWNE